MKINGKQSQSGDRSWESEFFWLILKMICLPFPSSQTNACLHDQKRSVISSEEETHATQLSQATDF